MIYEDISCNHGKRKTYTTGNLLWDHTWGRRAWGLWRARRLGAWGLGRARGLGRRGRLRVGVEQRVSLNRRGVILDAKRLDDAWALRACALAVEDWAHGTGGHD